MFLLLLSKLIKIKLLVTFDFIDKVCYDNNEISMEWCESAAHYIKNKESNKKRCAFASFFVL